MRAVPKRSVLLLATAALTCAAPAAGAADPVQTLRPVDLLAMTGPGAPSSCTAAADDPLSEEALRAQSDRRQYLEEALTYGSPAIAARPIVTLCDPARLAAGLPGRGLAGTLARTVAPVDSVAAGFRQLAAATVEASPDDGTTSAGGGLRAGDALGLPAASPGSVFTAWLQSGAGVTRVAFAGWADGTHAATATVAATSGGLRLTIARADGRSWAAEAPRLVTSRVRISGSIRNGEARITVRGVPRGAWVFAGADSNALAHAKAGTARLRIAVRGRRSEVALVWAALDRRAYRFSRCDIRRSGALRCEPVQSADGLQATRAVQARKPSPAPTERLGHRVAAVPQVAARSAALAVPADAAPVGDLNGDGRGDFVAALGTEYDDVSASGDGGVFLSTPTGMVRGPGALDGAQYPRSAGDLDGDGTADLLLKNGVVALGTGGWATTPAPAMPVPEAVAGQTRFLRLGGPDTESPAGTGPQAIAPLPDVTGDGRPELAATFGEHLLVFSSADLRAGTDVTAPMLAFGGEDASPVDPSGFELPEGPVVDAAGVHALEFVTAPGNGSDRSVVRIRTIDATGRLTAQTTPLATPGTAALVDHDTLTGDWLVVARTFGCGIGVGEPCQERTFRLRPDGQVRSAFLRKSPGYTFGPPAFFGPDGPDGDTERDVYLENDGIRVLASTTTGTAAFGALPVLSSAGRPLDLSFTTGYQHPMPRLSADATSFPAQSGRARSWVEVTP